MRSSNLLRRIGAWHDKPKNCARVMLAGLCGAAYLVGAVAGAFLFPSSSALAGALTLLGAGGSSPPPIMLTWRYAGFTGQQPNTTWATNATKARQLHRVPDAIMSPSDRCAVWWDNWAFTGAETSGTATFSVVAESIEINGITVPITFSAARTKTFTAGQALVFSDTFDASSFGLAYFPTGTRVWLKGVGQTSGSTTDLTVDRGVMNAAGGGATVSGAISGYYQSPGDNTDTNQVDTAGAWNIGAITTGGSAVAANTHFPSGIVCRTTSTAQPIVAVVDSLGDGYLAFNFDFTSGTGGMVRAAAWSAQKPLFTFGKFGTKPTQFGAKTTAIVQAQYSSSRLFAAGLQESGTNEFDGVNAIGTIETTYSTLWSMMADASHGGARPVYAVHTVIPNQTATDGATSYANQSKYSGGPAYFEAFNTWEDGKGPAGDGTVQGVFDFTGMYNPAQSNKITVIGRSWTLSTSVSAGATTLRLSGATAPQAGDGLWIAGTGAEGAMIGTVTVVTPGSVWDVALYGTSNTQLNIGGATLNAHSSGVTVSASYQPLDLSHFTQNGASSIAASWVGSAPFN